MKPKRIIGLNALYLKWGINAGTETYFTNIVMPWYATEQGNTSFILYCNQLPPWWEGKKEWFDAVVIPSTRNTLFRILWEQLWFPLTLSSKIQLLFSPGYVGSINLSTRQVITVPDGYAWRYPSEAGTLRSAYWRFAIPRSIGSDNQVIAISESTAADIVSLAKVKSEQVHVIHAAGGHLQSIASDLNILQKLSITPGEYFHCVGFFKAIKNPNRILDAFQLHADHVSSGYQKKLVLVGNIQGEFAELLEERARSMRNVIVAGRLSDPELAALYRGSAGLIFASLYEGFGIPILEAQSLLCPVITSNVSSMPEVAGDAAILVDPASVQDMSTAMQQLYDTSVNAHLAARGEVNVRRFSWKTASQQTLNLLSAKIS